jgi:hypothetical protein
MNHLRRRVERLEAVVKREVTSEDRSNKPYKLSDWTDEELDLFITALDQDKPLPPDLEAKLQLTDLVHTRTAGMTPGEIDAVLDQLQQDDDDDPNDDLSAYMDGGISK